MPRVRAPATAPHCPLGCLQSAEPAAKGGDLGVGEGDLTRHTAKPSSSLPSQETRPFQWVTAWREGVGTLPSPWSTTVLSDSAVLSKGMLEDSEGVGLCERLCVSLHT